MQNYLSELVETRVREIEQELREINGAYALVVESSRELYDCIEPIVQSENNLTISVGDCVNFREYLEQELGAADILEKALYRQGYLDCISLLKRLGLLTDRAG